MDPTDLDSSLDARLRALPAPTAPRTLLPRIMATVQASAQQPWHARPWRQWPRHWQVTSLAGAAAVIAIIAVVIAPAMRPSTTAPLAIPDDLVALARGIDSITVLMQVTWRTLLAPVIPYALVIVLMMTAACAAFGLALNRLVFGKVLPE